MRLDGALLSSPARIWIEMGQYLPKDELIALGDQLVRWPRQAYEGRSEPWTTLARLDELVRRHPNTRGAVNLRAALREVRVGADSRPETFFRLAIVRHGLPEPKLQVRLDPFDQSSVTTDLGYPDLLLGLQYDGAFHFSPETQARDMRRDWKFESAGWTIMKANRVDYAEGFSSIVLRIEEFVSSHPGLLPI